MAPHDDDAQWMDEREDTEPRVVLVDPGWLVRTAAHMLSMVDPKRLTDALEAWPKSDDKLTQGVHWLLDTELPADPDAQAASPGLLLDIESLCSDNRPSVTGLEACPFLEPRLPIVLATLRDLVMTVRRAAGRAGFHRPRAKYFEPVEPLDAANQEERTKRSRAANQRRAVTRASDHAVATNCRLFLTGTFDNDHVEVDPVEAARSYLEAVAREHQRTTGRKLHYVAVVGTEGVRQHMHAIVSADADHEILTQAWIHGYLDGPRLVAEDEIRRTVRYMGKNVEHGRTTYARFLRSRGGGGEVIRVNVRDVEDGRETLKDIIHPAIPVLVNARIFSSTPRVSFEFPPIRPDNE
jgi:hypothetical protein